MSRLAIAIVASLLAGFAVGAYVLEKGTEKQADGVPVAGSEANATNDQRLQYLERVVREEREARLVLEEQLIAVLQQLSNIESAESIEARSGSARRTASEGAMSSTRGRGETVDVVSMMSRFQRRRIETLVAGGFSEDEAKRLLQQESEAQYAVMLADYEARRNGTDIDWYSSSRNSQAIFREQLGDIEYERFLAAQGQATSVRVASVLDGAPGNRAGLLPGDQIISYNGERTFSMAELRQLTLQGSSGETVVIEIDRNGVRMQLSVPRGPIGMNGSGARVRGMSRWGG
jgi:membrane-associated protease RseP (regulator of RpoE activity)